MKKISFLAFVLAAFGVNAQIRDTCEIWFNDTVAYVDAKTSAYSGISINQVNDQSNPGSYGYAGYAQMFEAPDTVTIEGVCFYGVMDSGSSFSAAVKMYDVSGGAPGAMVAGTTHVIPYFGSGYTGSMNDPSILQCAMFPSPIEWEGDYFLGIENFSSSDMYIARNANGDGAAEALSYTYYKGVVDPTYDGWYQMYGFGAGWNFDLIIRPVVSYKAQSVVTYDTLICLGDTLNLEYEFTLEDSVLYNKFYNPGFATYDGSLDSIGFDYGDMSSPTADTFHTYVAGGSYDIAFTALASTSGWGADNFMSQCVYSTEVIDPSFDITDQSACDGDTVYFVAPIDYDNYLWNDLSTNDSLMIDTDGMMNGEYMYYLDVDVMGCSASDSMLLNIGGLTIDLGGDTTVCLNQNVVLAAGTYDSYDWNTGQTTESIQVGPFANPGSEEIVLTVTQGNCSGSDTLMITIDNCLGVEHIQSEGIKLYPNPSNGYFHIEAISVIRSVNVMTLTGQLVKTVVVTDQNVLDITDVSDGVYLLEIETDLGVEHKKVRVIRWNSW